MKLESEALLQVSVHPCKMLAGTVTTSYLYSSYNRLTQENTSTWTATLTYDNNGNLKKLVNGSTTWNYYFDALNQLTGVSKNGAKMQNNTYDGSGRRIEQNSSSSTIVYVYQGSSILYQKNLSSSTITKSFYANGMQVGQLVGSTSYYLQQDNIGSTRLATTGTGSIQFSSNYLPFGSSYSPSGSGIYFLFTGKLMDALTGLYYFGARYYDSVSGRFITEDSYSGSEADPQSENRYIYARDNPTSMIDPTGHVFISPSQNYYDPSIAPLQVVTIVTGTSSTVVTTTTSQASTIDQSTMIQTLATTTTTVTVRRMTTYTTTELMRNGIIISSTMSSITTIVTTTETSTVIQSSQMPGPPQPNSCKLITPTPPTPDKSIPESQMLAGTDVVLFGLLGVGLVVGGFFSAQPEVIAVGGYVIEGSAEAGEYVYIAGPNATPEHVAEDVGTAGFIDYLKGLFGMG